MHTKDKRDDISFFMFQSIAYRPSVGLGVRLPFQGGCIKPLPTGLFSMQKSRMTGSLYYSEILAEGEGFEPPEG